jgi:carboxylesterase type B
MLRSLIIPVIALVFALFGAAGATNDTVRVEGGLISVSVVDEVRIYQGPPFAARPMGEPRWKAPLPVAAWEGDRKCDDFGSGRPQAPYSQSSLHYSAPHEQSEGDIAAAFLGRLSDSSFTLPMRTWARMAATGLSKAHLYFFSHVPPNPNSKYLGSYQAGEIVYVFNNLNPQNPPLQGADYELAEMMSNYLVNFAMTGEVRQIMEKRGGVGVAGPPPAPGA